MFPFGLPFGGAVSESEEEVTVDSSKEDLWEEIVELRDKLKLMESGKIAAERLLDSVVEGHVHEGKPILVVKGAESYEDMQKIAEMWAKRHPSGAVFAIPRDIQLQDLDDKDLAQIGLKRVSSGPITERDEYDMMLSGK